MTIGDLPKLFWPWPAMKRKKSAVVGTGFGRRPAQWQDLAERLGYRKAERLLIVHADDLAITHSVNAAFFRGFECGLVNSGSVMVCCPWFPEVVAYAREHPELDLGIHLTLTSERTHYRWGPAAQRNDIPSLVDNLGYLHQKWMGETRINLREVEIELRAQIEKAYAAGLRPTHLKLPPVPNATERPRFVPNIPAPRARLSLAGVRCAQLVCAMALPRTAR